ncbi:sensor histidine kinase [Frankia tisae]|uniref:sensor histidine kinase n=1 Tax=Frankia tisae TaxID=2950104 RepID=UPI0021C239AF|nr:ATP-binding protein [Frankia tisae]
MTSADPAGPADPAAETPLAPGVLRLAASLPSTGPRGGDLTPVAAWIGEQVGASLVVLRVPDPAGPTEPDGPDGPSGPSGPAGPGTPSGPRGHRWAAPGHLGPPMLASVTTTHPIRHRGVDIAALEVTLPPPADTYHQTDTDRRSAAHRLLVLHRRLDEVAAVLGVVVSAAAAQAAARGARRQRQGTVARIADARQRAASLMESERHALERDLHDGAQLHLVSLQLAAAVVEHRLATGTADENTLADALTDLAARLDRTHQLLVDTAAGIMPGPLRADGLAPALALSLREAHEVTLEIAPDVGARRYPPIVESTVYFTCLEAVNNAHKHAPGAPVTVAVRNTYHGLWFEIADSGPGLSTAGSLVPTQLRARLAAVGGTLQVTSTPGTGTRVVGTIPI